MATTDAAGTTPPTWGLNSSLTERQFPELQTLLVPSNVRRKSHWHGLHHGSREPKASAVSRVPLASAQPPGGKAATGDRFLELSQFVFYHIPNPTAKVTAGPRRQDTPRPHPLPEDPAALC